MALTASARPATVSPPSRRWRDASRLGLLGYSFGGWLAVRAAARQRLAVVACVDGIFDAGASDVMNSLVMGWFEETL